MKLPENKWLRAAVPALLIHCSIGTVYCWSSFSGELSNAIGASSSVMAWAFSIAIFFLGMSAAFAGKFVEKDIHKSSLLACICFTIGMVGTGVFIAIKPFVGTTVSVIGIFLCYGCIMGIGLGVGYLTPVKTLMLWFSENKGLATGISIMGFGLAKAIASPIMNALVESVGLVYMFFILAAVYFVMMMLGHFLLKKPEGWREDAESTVKLKDMIKNKTFVGCWIMFYLNITCGLALISCEKPMLKLIGAGTAIISVIQSLTAASNALGRIGFSTVSDKMKDRNTVYLIIFVISIAISAYCYFTKAVLSGSVVMIAVLLVLINAGYGGGFSTMPALLSSRFGMKDISKIHGLVLSAWGFAGLTGNQLSTALYAKTGKYETVLIVIAVLYLVALVISAVMVKSRKAK